MAINLETDFIKYESTGATAYYGYARPGTDTSSKEWSIRQVIGTGPSLSVSWNLNSEFVYTGIWDNKEDHFTYASASLNPTYSSVESTNSFNVTTTFVDISWSEYTGIDIYRLKITDQNGILYNHLHTQAVNPYVINKYTVVTKETNYKFVGVPNMTYSVSFYLVNSTGENLNGSSLTITT
jgi:hypothetical protein